jgi:hypothetical protein
LMSDLSGQSAHALPDQFRQVRANYGLMHSSNIRVVLALLVDSLVA